MKKAILHYAWKAAATLAAALLVVLGAHWALGALLTRLIDIWGVTPLNAHMAPTWVQLIYYGSGQLISAVAQLLLCPLAWAALKLLNKKPLPSGRGAGAGALAGLILGAALFGLLIWMDALRITTVQAPSIMLAPSIALNITAALGGEALFRGALLGMGDNAPFALKAAVSALAFALMTAAFEPLSLICALLTGALMCLMYRRFGGFLAGALMRMTLAILLYGVLGCPGGSPYAPLATHFSQLTYLSGGANGPTNGLIYAALILLMMLPLLKGLKQRR